MDFTSIFFIILSLIVILYFALSMISDKKRPHLLIEGIFLVSYIFVMLIFFFPDILTAIEDFFGIQSAINFILYLSIFIAYLVIFMFYKTLEKRRVEITKLTREIAYLKNEQNNKK